MNEVQKTARAMAALDAMAAIWAATFNLREAVNAMMSLPDGENRLIDLIKQAHAEGLFAGRTSHQTSPSRAQLPQLTADELAALQRFCDTCEDGEGYDVRKPMMKRLACIGVVNHASGGIYAITEFGRHIIEQA